jgi:hypothetical protein
MLLFADVFYGVPVSHNRAVRLVQDCFAVQVFIYYGADAVKGVPEVFAKIVVRKGKILCPGRDLPEKFFVAMFRLPGGPKIIGLAFQNRGAGGQGGKGGVGGMFNVMKLTDKNYNKNRGGVLQRH